MLTKQLQALYELLSQRPETRQHSIMGISEWSLETIAVMYSAYPEDFGWDAGSGSELRDALLLVSLLFSAEESMVRFMKSSLEVFRSVKSLCVAGEKDDSVDEAIRGREKV